MFNQLPGNPLAQAIWHIKLAATVGTWIQVTKTKKSTIWDFQVNTKVTKVELVFQMQATQGNEDKR